jgi:phosphoglucomutase/phosphomannomutase
MPENAVTLEVNTALQQIDTAAAVGRLSSGAVDNLRRWLTEERYSESVPKILKHIAGQQWKELDDAFWTVIPFGTGGRRGRMYEFGSNTINDRTIGESAQGLADYVKQHRSGSGPLACAIAYDTRHNSPRFARLCAEIMVAAGFTVYFLDDYRSTPELSFLVRYKKCCCGIMVTASHNPPSDNAVKVYWSTGGQILPPHDEGVIQQVMSVGEIHRYDFDQALIEGKVVLCREQVDRAFLAAVSAEAFPGPRDLNVIYSPLHGVGASAVIPALQGDGFDVELFADHAELSGDFPNVPNHVSNPENAAVFDSIIRRAREVRADVILASDPDCDRLGVAAPLTLDSSSAWGTFNGNQIGALLVDYILERRNAAGTLSRDHYVVKTLVTSEMIRRIADSYGVKTFGDLQVGFKWIAEVMDAQGPDKFVFGAEESHGYLVGQYARDKDGVVASMLMAELAALTKSRRQSLHEKLDALYWQHGYHSERLMTQQMPGSEGMVRMQELMEKFRLDPPRTLGGIAVSGLRDYKHGQYVPLGGTARPLIGPINDMVIFDLASAGNYVAARPSGTEPKVKFYMFTYVAPEQLADLNQAKAEMDQRLAQFRADLEAFAASV